MKKLLFALLFVLAFGIPAVSEAFDVKLAWDPSASQDIKEYVMHYDTASGTPKTNSESAGLALEITISGLTEGVIHYFHVTAKDWEGRESGPSNEVRTDGIDTLDTGQDPMAPGGCYIVTIMP